MHLNTSRLHFSQRFFWLTFFLHLISMMFVLVSGILFSFKLLLCFSLCAHLFWSARQPKHFFPAMGKDIDDHWYVVDHEGEKHNVTLLAGTILTKYFVLLMFKLPQGQKKYLPIFSDTLVEDDFRRLRVLLWVEKSIEFG